MYYNLICIFFICTPICTKFYSCKKWVLQPVFRASRSDAVADAAWQAIASWVRSNKSRLQNSVHYLLPYRKKDQFKSYEV
jgi:hypothetical protein